MSGDEVSVKCKGSKGEHDAVEIEKIDKVNDDQSIEVDAVTHRWYILAQLNIEINMDNLDAHFALGVIYRAKWKVKESERELSIYKRLQSGGT